MNIHTLATASQNQQPTPDLVRLARVLLFTLTLVLSFTLAADTASARTTRVYQNSFGFFKSAYGTLTPEQLAVDQSNGDVYVSSRSIEGAKGAQPIVSRFSPTGVPKNFTVGPGAGTNSLTGFPASELSVAVDNSGGPLNGVIYVVVGELSFEPGITGKIEVYTSNGASLGSITGIKTPAGGLSRSLCGATIDQASGALFVTDGSQIVRFAPSSPVAPIEDLDYKATGIFIGKGVRNCDIAAEDGDLYVLSADAIERYDESSFTTTFFNEPVPTTIDTGKLDSRERAIAVDPQTGDLYLDRGDEVSVFDSAGLPLYHFGAPAYFRQSSAIAVKSALSGPATQVYVADPGIEASISSPHEVDVFAGFVKVQTFTHKEDPDASFGSDGASSSSFSSGAPGPLAFNQASRRLYVADGGAPGIYGFDASSPTSFPPLAGFSPLSTAALDTSSGLAVDNTALPSAGNVYLASRSADLLYGWDSSGTPLGGAFPIDSATSPGAPDGSPKDLCGAAVDSQGDVWISNSATQRILEYSSAGASLPGSIDTSAIGSPCNLAFDSGDDLYVGINGNEARRSGIWRYTITSGYTSATRVAQERPDAIFAVDPSTDRLYVKRGGSFQEGVVEIYEPTGQLFDEFDLGIDGDDVSGIAVDETNQFVFVANKANRKVLAFSPGLLFPEVSTRPATVPTNATMTLNGLVNTQGVALSDCHFEYVTALAFDETGFSDLSSGGTVPCTPAAGSVPLDLENHAVSAVAAGLAKDTRYRFRLSAANADGVTVSDDAGFTTAGPPLVETTGSPVRSATTVRLEGRVYAARATTTYRFEYGTEGSCDANPCESTEPHSAGSGNEVQLVSRWIEGLEPNTTYHYRVVADNGNPLGPSTGNHMVVTTRSSDAPLSHGDLPGPPGSDRAYEQVSMPDTGGNPVSYARAVSSDGNRAFYGVSGGTPISKTGNYINSLYAERIETAPHRGSWHSQDIGPPREELVGSAWTEPTGDLALSDQVSISADPVTGAGEIWRLRPGQPAIRVFQPGGGLGQPMLVSEDASRVIVRGSGSFDPAHPLPDGLENLYDVSSGTPKLVGLLPGGSPPPCDAQTGPTAIQDLRAPHWLSIDGSLLFFQSCSNLYMRDIDAEQSKLIANKSDFVKWAPGAVFLLTYQGLEPGDTDGSRDVYRYDLASEELKCVTCVTAPGLQANVGSVLVAPDGSRIYFITSNSLLPGADAPGLYRVDLASEELAYVASGADITLSEDVELGNAITPDGAAFIFASKALGLNAIGGQQNGGTLQYYRYDDRDRSLTCLSCPQDGSPPFFSTRRTLLSVAYEESVGANKTALSENGRTFAFATPTALLGPDQNTARPGQHPMVGADVYEWRDGRLLLVTDGLNEWPSNSPPEVSAITPSGSDIFFTAAAQYTSDALDGFKRLYDARIGGGFEFPLPPKPCALEVCQGTPKGAPEEQVPGTGSFTGPGNAATGPGRRTCPRGRHAVRRGGKARCVRKRDRRTNDRQRAKRHDRRSSQ